MIHSTPASFIPTKTPETFLERAQPRASFSMPARATNGAGSNTLAKSDEDSSRIADIRTFPDRLRNGVARLSAAMRVETAEHCTQHLRAALVAIIGDVRGTAAQREREMSAGQPNFLAEAACRCDVALARDLEKLAGSTADPQTIADTASRLIRTRLAQLPSSQPRRHDAMLPSRPGATASASTDTRGGPAPAAPRFPTVFHMSRFRTAPDERPAVQVTPAAVNPQPSSAASTSTSGSVKRKHEASPHGLGAAPLHVAAATATVPPRDPQMAIDLLRQGGFIVPDDFTLQIPPSTFKGSIEGKMRRANTAAVYALPTRERLTNWQKQDILKAINSSYPTRLVLMSDDSRRAAQGPQGVSR